MGSAFQAVIFKVQAQCLHDALKMPFNQINFFFITFHKSISSQGGFQRGRMVVDVVVAHVVVHKRQK